MQYLNSNRYVKEATVLVLTLIVFVFKHLDLAKKAYNLVWEFFGLVQYYSDRIRAYLAEQEAEFAHNVDGFKIKYYALANDLLTKQKSQLSLLKVETEQTDEGQPS